MVCACPCENLDQNEGIDCWAPTICVFSGGADPAILIQVNSPFRLQAGLKDKMPKVSI